MTTNEDIVSELCSRVFASLPRRDQRQRGEQYVRGLLTTPGRKSVRNIASGAGGGSAVQRLHHFVACSTWDWLPVRAALASHLQDIAEPVAWVVQTLAIPKSGVHSVGVGRRLVPQTGQTKRGQHALGVWLTAPAMSTPISWRLLLPERWIRDDGLRRRAEVPERASYETLEQSVVAAVTETRTANVLRRPVLLDAPGAWARPTVLRAFADADIPLVARVPAGTRMIMADRSMPGYGAGPLSAQQLLMSVRGLGRRVEWHDAAQGTLRTSIAVMVPVRTAHSTGVTAERRLYLLGEWDDLWRSPTRIWLTDLAAPVGGLLRLTKVTQRVSHALATTGKRVGLLDFEGRSYPGWHRHATLASVAHAACLLAGAGAVVGPADPATNSPLLTA
ncbi:transposase [Streptomyces sp. CC224B]|uniref:IS701 family transposase n=1 Tax=Streptomyces sp. CC224B TaxID=3044571 RepID=UPI0024AA01AE|nr:transposase [Streptomyces sp. CC224B]